MKRTYHSYKPFIDLFLLLVAGLTLMFMVAFMLIRPKEDENHKNIEQKAEIAITVTWPNECKDDVDTYVEDGAGSLVYFQRREDGLMALDRDDQGDVTDRIYYGPGPNQFIEYKENREIVTVRGLVPGEYTVNVHMYSKRVPAETPVSVTVEKLNPRITLVAARTVVLRQRGDEKTVIRFTVTPEGEITNVREEEKPIAMKRLNPEGSQYYDQELFNNNPDEPEGGNEAGPSRPQPTPDENENGND